VDLDLAPDGRHAAGSVVEGGRFVLRILDFDRRTDDALDLPGSNWDPHWNPDGRRLAIRSMKGGQYDAYLLDLAGGPPKPLLVTDRDDMPEGWTFDGKFVLVRQATEKSGYPLYKMDPDHPESMTRLLDTGDVFAASPDGHWLAFTSSRSEREELYVQPMSANARPQRVSTQGATALSWSRKGHEIFYARGLDIIAVSYREEQGQFKVEKERVWATVKGLDAERIFEAAPDGRIIIDLPATPPPPPQIRVVLGLASELARKFEK
jgi:Tol biopolymer transport system component